MGALVSVRKHLREMQQRESSAYEQVKQAVQMAEEANLEKTKVSSSRRWLGISVFLNTTNVDYTCFHQ